MRRTITLDGVKFTFRPFTQRDVIRATGALGILSTDDPGEGSSILTIKRCDQIDRLIAICVKVPTMLLDEPKEVPEGSMPIAELSDSAWTALVAELSDRSGWTQEASDEIRPSSGIVEGS
jgi:hypothetical protein